MDSIRNSSQSIIGASNLIPFEILSVFSFSPKMAKVIKLQKQIPANVPLILYHLMPCVPGDVLLFSFFQILSTFK